MKVYVVTSGKYSEYGIEAVFDNLIDAKKYCAIKDDQKAYDYESRSIEVYDTDKNKVIADNVYVAFKYTKCNRIPGTVIRDYDYASSVIYSTHPIEKKIDVHEHGYHIDILIPLKDDSVSDEYKLKIGRDEYAKYMAEREGL